jgi:hypothetical protein
VASFTSRLFCTRCHQGLPADDWNAPEMRPCRSCDALFRAITFPALSQQQRPIQPAQAAEEGEAACFYHPRKRAATPCDNCGRFLCALCEIEFRGERWCPGCFESGQRKRTNRHLQTRHTHYDTIALGLAALPALILWPTLIGAPMALYVAIRYWRAPVGILPRTRIRYYLAVALAGVQVIGWIWLFAYLMARR